MSSAGYFGVAAGLLVVTAAKVALTRVLAHKRQEPSDMPNMAQRSGTALGQKTRHCHAGSLATGLAPCVRANPSNLDQWSFNEQMKKSGWPIDGYRYEPIWNLRIANPWNMHRLALVHIQVSHADSHRVIAAAQAAGFVMRPDFDPTPLWLDELESRRILGAMGLSYRQVTEKVFGPGFDAYVQGMKAQFVSDYAHLRYLEFDRHELLAALEHRDRNGYTYRR